MSYAKILSSQFIKTVTTASGRVLEAKYATKTPSWKRILLAQMVQDHFCSTLEKTIDIPARATAAILVKQERSSSDDRKYFNTVFQDGKGKYVASKRLYP
ncbi:hypothetical protein yc1106_03044 [Curvularia clavata]|uniref:Uncharacterized protein n=1 Tax=Curvularia clavata TaxID=95742 RepID=A0A9Q8Z5Z2_CURCL|nr:hypothetical protein yc1106_03044 [Curvularia clavata]